jgi:hypothetical protein
MRIHTKNMKLDDEARGAGGCLVRVMARAGFQGSVFNRLPRVQGFGVRGVGLQGCDPGVAGGRLLRPCCLCNVSRLSSPFASWAPGTLHSQQGLKGFTTLPAQGFGLPHSSTPPSPQSQVEEKGKLSHSAFGLAACWGVCFGLYLSAAGTLV